MFIRILDTRHNAVSTSASAFGNLTCNVTIIERVTHDAGTLGRWDAGTLAMLALHGR
jgi:hypothetical protein